MTKSTEYTDVHGLLKRSHNGITFASAFRSAKNPFMKSSAILEQNRKRMPGSYIFVRWPLGEGAWNHMLEINSVVCRDFQSLSSNDKYLSNLHFVDRAPFIE